MEQVAQFRILNKIGAGGMGEVYRARDEKLQRDVAIKLLPAAQFEDETRRGRRRQRRRPLPQSWRPRSPTLLSSAQSPSSPSRASREPRRSI